MSEIKLFGDPVLHNVTMAVDSLTGLKELEARLLAAMKESGGIGIAANQIGVPLSMFVMMIERGGTLTVINPVYTQKSLETHIFDHDGCLSLPGVSAPTRRRDWVTVKYQRIDGEYRTAVFQGLEAVIVQHEMDHLNGLLYINRLGKLKREFLLKKYHKLSKESLLTKSST